MGGGKPGGLIRTTASTRRRIREPIGIRTDRVGTPAGGKRCGDKGVARRTSRLAPTSTGSQSPARALADCHRCRAAGWGCHVTADGDAPDPGGAFARLRIGARRSAASCRGCCASRRADARRRVSDCSSAFGRLGAPASGTTVHFGSPRPVRVTAHPDGDIPVVTSSKPIVSARTTCEAVTRIPAAERHARGDMTTERLIGNLPINACPPALPASP